MFQWKSWAVGLFTLLATSMPLLGVDVILEAKAAYFLPTYGPFRTIYGQGGGLYGGELSVQMGNHSRWYGFLSLDYFGKSGCTECVPAPTSINLWIGAVGIKCFLPTFRDCFDFYLGLGIEPIYTRIKNCSPYVDPIQRQWTAGGIAKVGAYCRLPKNFVLDFFVDYSAAQLTANDQQRWGCCVVPVNFYIGGFIFGGGLGYCF